MIWFPDLGKLNRFGEMLRDLAISLDLVRKSPAQDSKSKAETIYFRNAILAISSKDTTRGSWHRY